MYVVLLRHATRDTQVMDDGGLSATGHAQAEHLIQKLLPTGPLPEPSVLIASPKKRARETLHPIAHHLSVPLLVSNALDERAPTESGEAFEARVRSWFASLEENFAADEVIWACSHADWLEEVMQLMDSNLDEWERMLPFAPAQFAAFEIKDGFWSKQGKAK